MKPGQTGYSGAGYSGISSESGVTLLELIIALSLILIISVGLAPGARSEQRALYKASLRLQADLREAQQMAVLEGIDYLVVFSPGNGSYSLRRGALIPPDRTVKLDNGVIYDDKRVSVTFEEDRMRINRRGVCNGGTIRLRAGKYTQEVTVVPVSGRVTVKQME